MDSLGKKILLIILSLIFLMGFFIIEPHIEKTYKERKELKKQARFEEFLRLADSACAVFEHKSDSVQKIVNIDSLQTIGPFKLGMTRKQYRKALEQTRKKNFSFGGMDFIPGDVEFDKKGKLAEIHFFSLKRYKLEIHNYEPYQEKYDYKAFRKQFNLVYDNLCRLYPSSYFEGDDYSIILPSRIFQVKAVVFKIKETDYKVEEREVGICLSVCRNSMHKDVSTKLTNVFY